MAYQPQVIVNSGEYISTVETEPRPIKHVDFFDSPDSFREKKKQIIGHEGKKLAEKRRKGASVYFLR